MPKFHYADSVSSNNPFSFTTHVGAIFNNGEARGKCDQWLNENGLDGVYKFSGVWETPKDEWNTNSIATFVKINELSK